MKAKGYRERRLWCTDDEYVAVKALLARLRGPKKELPETLKPMTGTLPEMPETIPGTHPETPEMVCTEPLPESTKQAREMIRTKPESSWYDAIFGWLLALLFVAWVVWRFLT